jgi:site-specific recombinase XerD
MTKQITPLRQRMLDDMALRNMSPATQRVYINAVKNFSAFFGRSPDKLTFEDVRNYQMHLVSRGLKTATIVPIMCAIRFLYGTTLGRKDAAKQIPLARKEDKLHRCEREVAHRAASGTWRASRRGGRSRTAHSAGCDGSRRAGHAAGTAA